MATRVTRVDDLDNRQDAVEIGVILRLNEVTVVLDLGDENWKLLNEFLAPYVHAGTPWTPPAPPQKRKLNQDERNGVLSYLRNVKGSDTKRITAEIIAEYDAYIEQRDKELLAKLPGEHASESAINGAIAAGESTQTPVVNEPTSGTTGTRRTRK